MEMRKLVFPEMIFGDGVLELCGTSAQRLGMKKVLLVSDQGVRSAGWTDMVMANLGHAGIPFVVHDEITANPKDNEVDRGVEIFCDAQCDGIVAVGGGSPMDCAKGIGVVVANGGRILDYEGVDRIAIPMPPLICVPTTAGSSADVSQFAIITDSRRKVKIAVISKAIVPDLALICPAPLTTMDANLTACTALDALTHAIEAYVSNASSPLTDVHALSAIRRVCQFLVPCIHAPDDMSFRSELMLASMEAGMAFSNASLGAVHAMAHSLGGAKDLPHGACNALLLEHVIRANFSYETEKYRRIARVMGVDVRQDDDGIACDKLTAAIHALRRSAGVSSSLKDYGVEEKDVQELASHAAADPCLATNPFMITIEQLKGIYRNALGS